MQQYESLLSRCRLCPRACGANRLLGQTGVCGASKDAIVARAALHRWEEPCISGTHGSGAVFFSGCPLRCVYCQNEEISHHISGRRLSVSQLGNVFFSLQRQGAHNLNLVTATPYAPHVLAALEHAKAGGFCLPVVYNTSGYENAFALELLRGHVNVYLADFKYLSPQLAKRYSCAVDYPGVAQAALDEMVRQTGPCRYDQDGLLVKGTIVRHLMLPGCPDDTRQVLRYLHDRYGDEIAISLMCQYTPTQKAAKAHSPLGGRITKQAYARMMDYALSLGIQHGYFQELDSASNAYLPAFDGTGLPQDGE